MKVQYPQVVLAMMETTSSQDTVNKKVRKVLLCPKCKAELNHRIKRGFLLKSVLNWLPVKRFYCFKCKRKQYIWN